MEEPFAVTPEPHHVAELARPAEDRAPKDLDGSSAEVDFWRLVGVPGPPGHLLQREGIAIGVAERGVLDASADVEDRADVDAVSQKVGACLFDVGAVMIDLVPVMPGAGKPWFSGLTDVVHLNDPVITPGEGVTHLLYRVRRWRAHRRRLVNRTQNPR